MTTSPLKQYASQLAAKYQDKLDERKDVLLSISLNDKAQQELMKDFKTRSDFLNSINWITVKNQKDKKIFGALKGTTTGRKQDGRNRSIVEYGDIYQLQEIDSGVQIDWRLIDELEVIQDNFSENFTRLTEQQFILDMLQMGWYGESEATNTQAEDLSDVVKGWLAQLKEQNPANIITGGKSAGKITLFSEQADYKNLDELATALRNKLPAQYQERNDLVFFVGADLVAKANANIQGAFNYSENNGINNLYLSNYFGGMPAIIPPQFPRKCAVVTTLKNLSIYTQKGSCHRSIYNDEETMDYISAYLRQECYIVENLNLMAAIEYKNVILGDEENGK
ncbi:MULTISPECIES: phage major capsid protein, P2 family [unclassified Pasteurella]|uniref:phage major capsid protein, P2 family n=1 Tax=unclassified Pasteurella TaxID=2621516 RepID=UPI001073F1D4|nr:phage major capsid protein, P2 family [Pasteurella sp. 19428wF3_WM03]TFU53082.1 phage major capsid protein, P2 family [Pasteurella sp. WM03]